MPRLGVVGATGAVGRVVVELLAERGFDDVRLFASSRSAGTEIRGRRVEEATPEAFAAGELDVCLFSVGASARCASTSRPLSASRTGCPLSSRR